jgi:hypothetical protein
MNFQNSSKCGVEPCAVTRVIQNFELFGVTIGPGPRASYLGPTGNWVRQFSFLRLSGANMGRSLAEESGTEKVAKGDEFIELKKRRATKDLRELIHER